jgi:signal transduction histidine kinase
MTYAFHPASCDRPQPTGAVARVISPDTSDRLPTADRVASCCQEGVRNAAAAAALAGVFVAAIGAIVLVGWTFHIDALRSMHGSITMKTNMAVGLLLCGLALCFHVRRAKAVGVICATVAAALGVLTLSEHLVGWDLGIDQLLFVEQLGRAARIPPNRMGVNGSMTLALSGAALLLLFRATPRTIRFAQRLAMACMVLATFAIAGYLYGAVAVYAIARYTGIALPTALAFVVLNAGILVARVDEGPMIAFIDKGPAGTLLRRLAVPVVAVPLALGYLVMLGRQTDLYDRGLSIALFAVSLVIAMWATIWQTAKVMAESDRHRRLAEQDRDDLLVRERIARSEAERASRLKDQFMAVLSHELRTPLNVMLGWTKALETNTLPERRAHAAAVVARNGRLLARLVEDLLDISRASVGQFELSRRPISFNTLVQGSLEALAPSAVAKNVHLRSELDPALGLLDADPDRLQQIVSNLVSNAIKFTDAGGRVTIRTALNGDEATFTVIDTGIGFDETFAAQLFQPFRQADSSTRREHGGLGLGLSIARHIAELHGGSITGYSAGPQRGATFGLRLPIRLTGDRPGAQEAASTLQIA